MVNEKNSRLNQSRKYTTDLEKVLIKLYTNKDSKVNSIKVIEAPTEVDKYFSIDYFIVLNRTITSIDKAVKKQDCFSVSLRQTIPTNRNTLIFRKYFDTDINKMIKAGVQYHIQIIPKVNEAIVLNIKSLREYLLQDFNSLNFNYFLLKNTTDWHNENNEPNNKKIELSFNQMKRFAVKVKY